MNKIVILSFIIFFFKLGFAQQPESLINQGNNSYSEGDYQNAVDNYEQVLSQGYISSELYYNLGNSYYKLNQLAPSILNYERGLLLAPNDEDILYNLELANQLVVDKIEELPVFFMKKWINSFILLLSSDVWAIISMVTFILFLIFFSLFLYSRSIGFKKLMFWLAFILILVCVASYFSSRKQLRKILNHDNAIVFTPSVTVKSSPNQDGTDLFVIHEGTKVGIEGTDRDWTEIRLSDGSIGWLKSADIVPI